MLCLGKLMKLKDKKMGVETFEKGQNGDMDC